MSDDLLARIVEKLRGVKGPNDRGDYTAWCVFHTDGEGALPHAPNLSVGPRGFICHACHEQGSLKKLAVKLGVDVPRPGREPEQVYPYRDERGVIVYEVVRFPGKKFRQRRPDGTGGWIWDLEGVSRVPYRLPELLTRSDEPVFVAEGEKDCDRLASLGLVATTNSCGAGQWRPEYSLVLAGRDVVLLPDNDKAGLLHVEKVAKSLVGVAKSVKVVELPDLPPKGDVSDWLDAGHTLEELMELVAQTVPDRLDDDAEDDADETSDAESSKKDSQAKVLVGLVLDSGVELFQDEREEPYLRVLMKRGYRNVRIGSRESMRFLAKIAWDQMRKAPGAEVLHAAARTLSSMACSGDTQHRLHVRHARDGDALWIDLDGYRAIKVVPGSWNIVDDPPILFRTFPHQLPFPEPTRDGDLSEVFRFVNLPEGDGRDLLLGYLPSVFQAAVPVVGLAVHGVQGAAKSSFLRVIKRLVDPSVPEVRGRVSKPEELAQMLYQNRALFLDNLTTLPDWMSDMLCGAITGDGWAKRVLYTDEDTIWFDYRRVVGVSGINLLARRPDLLDRCVIFELTPIPREQRVEEGLFWLQFEEARPRIFGGLLDALANAMEAFPNVRLEQSPRMADFCRWGASAFVGAGRTKEEFAQVYERNVGRQTEAGLEASPVGESVLAFMDGRDHWEGTPGELYDELMKAAARLRLDTTTRAWPKASNWLKPRLKEVQPLLERRGVRFDADGRTGSRRSVRLWRVPADAVTTVIAVRDGSLAPLEPKLDDDTPTDAVTDAVTPEAVPGGVPGRDDGGDTDDGICGATRPADGGAALDEVEREERAAIIEFDGGRTRAEAERAAAKIIPLPLAAETGAWW